jgi:hypothetical protein
MRALEASLATSSPRDGEYPIPVKTGDFTYRMGMKAAIKLDEAIQLDGLCRIYSGELVDDQNLIQLANQRANDIWLAREVSLIVTRVFLLDDDLRAFPLLAQRTIHALDQPPYERSGHFANREEWNAAGGRMTAMQSSVYRALVRQASVADLSASLSDLAVATAAFQAQQGEYPKDLGVLVPNYIDRIPIDPFDGEPLRITHAGEGAILHGSAWRKGSHAAESTCLYLGKEYRRRRVENREDD